MGPGYPTVSISSWAISSNWSGSAPVDDWVTLDDLHTPATALSYVQSLDSNFSIRYLDLGGAYMYVLAGAGTGGTGKTLTLTGAGVGTTQVVILRASAVSQSPANPLFEQTFYLGYRAGISSLGTNALANLHLNYSGMKAITVNHGSGIGANRRTLAITSNIFGTGGIIKNGPGTLVLELGEGATVSNTFMGNFQLDSGSVLVARDPDLFNANTSLRHSALGMGTLTITGGNLGSGDGQTHLIQNPIVLAGDFSISSPSPNAGLVLSGNFNLGGSTRTIQVNSSSTLSGTISGSGSITKTGTGTLTLSSNFTTTSANTVSGGLLALNNVPNYAHI